MLDPKYPKKWQKKPIERYVSEGYKYCKKKIANGTVYMILRKDKHDRGLGRWSEENEKKLFELYPSLQKSWEDRKTQIRVSRSAYGMLTINDIGQIAISDKSSLKIARMLLDYAEKTIRGLQK